MNISNHPHRILKFISGNSATFIHQLRYSGTYVPLHDTVNALKTCHKQKLVSYTKLNGKPGIWTLTRIGKLHVAYDLDQKINLIELNTPITINNVQSTKLQITVISDTEQTVCNCDNNWTKQQLIITLQHATILILQESPIT